MVSDSQIYMVYTNSMDCECVICVPHTEYHNEYEKESPF